MFSKRQNAVGEKAYTVNSFCQSHWVYYDTHLPLPPQSPPSTHRDMTIHSTCGEEAWVLDGLAWKRNKVSKEVRLIRG